MDAKSQALQEKLDGLLKQAAAIAAELQAHQRGPGVPHFLEIELPAHELGKRFSEQIMEREARELAAQAPASVGCPECGKECRCTTHQRTVNSIDGPVEMTEVKAHCKRCRRSFFSSASSAGN